MARFKHPHTVGLPFDAWPAGDRAAWEIAIAAGDPLDDQGAGAHWRPKTRDTARKAYGQWLKFLLKNRQLEPVRTVGDRLTAKRLRAYAVELKGRVSETTILTQFSHLNSAIKAMDPNADRSLLKQGIARMAVRRAAVATTVLTLPTPIELVGLGVSLMANWQSRATRDPRLNAMDYRDGLMIAFMAYCPIRFENLAQMDIDKHLRMRGRPRVVFSEDDMKAKRALEFDFPEALIGHLRFYLRTVRPMFLGYKGKSLWPSLHQTALSEHGIYCRFAEVTRRFQGVKVTPHDFRRSAATFVAEVAPEHALVAARILHHSSPQVTWRHYVRGQQHGALHAYHRLIDEVIVSVNSKTRRQQCGGRQ